MGEGESMAHQNVLVLAGELAGRAEEHASLPAVVFQMRVNRRLVLVGAEAAGTHILPNVVLEDFANQI